MTTPNTRTSSDDHTTPETAPDGTVDVAIIGGGAAGLTAALFIARAGLVTHISDQHRSTLKRAHLHNMPGHHTIEGNDLLQTLATQSQQAGATIDHHTVVDITPDTPFTIHLDNNTTYRARHILITTGQHHLNLPSLPIAYETPRQPFAKTNITTNKWGATNIPGIWAAGVAAGWPSQAAICTGNGAAVAIEIVNTITNTFWVDHN